MRAVLLAATVAVAIVVFAPTGTAAGTAWDAYLAPVGACPGATLTHAAADVQQRALVCLVNWTRGHVGLRRLSWSHALARAAGRKAAAIAYCGDFSHAPCGARGAVPSRRRFDIWGENLYWGVRGAASPRAAMRAWLESPEHRAILFGRPWKALGVTLGRARELEGRSGVAIWVLEVAGAD